MPQTDSIVRTLKRELALDGDESATQAMRRVDRAESDAVRRHLLGDITAMAATSAPSGRVRGGR